MDVGKAAVTTVAIGTAGAVAGFFGAPVVGVVLAGIAASEAINFANNKWKVTNSLKSGINSMIKRVSGWFK
ncbi:hypothetical protein OKS_04537 [Enterococcus faecium EnGen0047]|nr:hypothetical protein OKS_04537 [Enterococcus faecium EnGen0047]